MDRLVKSGNGFLFDAVGSNESLRYQAGAQYTLSRQRTNVEIR